MLEFDVHLHKQMRGLLHERRNGKMRDIRMYIYIGLEMHARPFKSVVVSSKKLPKWMCKAAFFFRKRIIHSISHLLPRFISSRFVNAAKILEVLRDTILLNVCTNARAVENSEGGNLKSNWNRIYIISWGIRYLIIVANGFRCFTKKKRFALQLIFKYCYIILQSRKNRLQLLFCSQHDLYISWCIYSFIHRNITSERSIKIDSSRGHSVHANSPSMHLQ